MSARLEHGDRQDYFEIAARAHARCTRRPRGPRLGPHDREPGTTRTGAAASRRSARVARGPRHAAAPSAEVCELIVRAKREKPRRSIRRDHPHARARREGRHGRALALQRAPPAARGRRLRASAARADAAGTTLERRSFLPEHAGDLWIGDALHGPRVRPAVGLRKAYCSRRSTAPRATSCTATSRSARARRRRSTASSRRSTSTDCRAPTTWISAPRTSPTRCGSSARSSDSPAARRRARRRGQRRHRAMASDAGARKSKTSSRRPPLTLDELNAIHWAWLGARVPRRASTTRPGALRASTSSPKSPSCAPCRATKNLDEVFLHREWRTVRKDGTVRWQGGYLEVRPELVGQQIELRFDPTDDTAPAARVRRTTASSATPSRSTASPMHHARAEGSRRSEPHRHRTIRRAGPRPARALR